MFSAMNGSAARFPKSCKDRATTSFPVPLSPQMSAEASLLATDRIKVSSSFIALVLPTMGLVLRANCEESFFDCLSDFNSFWVASRIDFSFG